MWSADEKIYYHVKIEDARAVWRPHVFCQSGVMHTLFLSVVSLWAATLISNLPKCFLGKSIYNIWVCWLQEKWKCYGLGKLRGLDWKPPSVDLKFRARVSGQEVWNEPFPKSNPWDFVISWCSNRWMGMATLCNDGNDSNLANMNPARWQLQ